MIKVYQTIIDKGHGNCMQAAIASLFELPLEEVPHFLEFKDEWFSIFHKFIFNKGYKFDGTLYNYNQWRLINKRKNEPTLSHRTRFYKLKHMEGVRGYFYASVYSPLYYNVNDKLPITHAVIINKNCNIIHDVNPLNANVKKYPENKYLRYNGILNVYMINPILK